MIVYQKKYCCILFLHQRFLLKQLEYSLSISIANRLKFRVCILIVNYPLALLPYQGWLKLFSVIKLLQFCVGFIIMSTGKTVMSIKKKQVKYISNNNNIDIAIDTILSVC